MRIKTGWGLLHALLANLILAIVTADPPALISSRPGNVHTLLLTDCAKYQDWQTIAAAFAWRESGQPGALTRVANCNDKDKAAYPKAMLDYVDTHMAPEAAYNKALKDWYAAYNKPMAVIDWLQHNPQPKEEWILLLDADMLVRRPFLPEHFNLSRGWAMAGHYDYMKGVANNLAMRHVPEIEPRKDTLAGPAGRRGDVVGAPYFMHMDDIRKVAPLWYNYTVEMRNDFEAYKDSGDTAAGKGQRIWIAEMYGYTFGAAKAGIWHHWGNDFMLYPGYTPTVIPRNIHYGLLYHVDNWSYDKHWYFHFDVHKCPPWNLDVEKPQEGIFPPPPHPNDLKSKDFLQEYRDLVAVQALSLVNAAVCDYHVRNCPPSQQLSDVCGKAAEHYAAVKRDLEMLEAIWDCSDRNNECESWAKRGECKTSESYMKEHCRVSCKYCEPKYKYTPKAERAKEAADKARKEAEAAEAADKAKKEAEAAKAAVAKAPESGPTGAALGDAKSEGGGEGGKEAAAAGGAAGAVAGTVGELLQKKGAGNTATQVGQQQQQQQQPEEGAQQKEGEQQQKEKEQHKEGEQEQKEKEQHKEREQQPKDGEQQPEAGAQQHDKPQQAEALLADGKQPQAQEAGQAGRDAQPKAPDGDQKGQEQKEEGKVGDPGRKRELGEAAAGDKQQQEQQQQGHDQAAAARATDDELRQRHPKSDSSYTDLVLRCSRARRRAVVPECVRAAGLGLEYRGDFRPLIEPALDEDPYLKKRKKGKTAVVMMGGKGKGGGGRGEGGEGGEPGMLGMVHRAEAQAAGAAHMAQQRLAGVHAMFHGGGGGKYGGRPRGGAAVRWDLVVLLIVAAAALAYWHKQRRGKWPFPWRQTKEEHRSE